MYVRMYVCKNNLTLYFTHLPRSPPSKDLHQNWYSGSSHGRNQLWQFFWQSVTGFGFCRGPKFAISHWLSRSPLTQCWRYRAARDTMNYFGSIRRLYVTHDDVMASLPCKRTASDRFSERRFLRRSLSKILTFSFTSQRHQTCQAQRKVSTTRWIICYYFLPNPTCCWRVSG